MFDLVLLDLTTPKLNGWDAFERMTAVNPFVPIIIITARNDQHENAAQAGASALMEKPIFVPLLFQTIERILAESLDHRVERMAAHRTLMVPSLG